MSRYNPNYKPTVASSEQQKAYDDARTYLENHQGVSSQEENLDGLWSLLKIQFSVIVLAAILLHLAGC